MKIGSEDRSSKVKSKVVLGISAYYHDAAAALVECGQAGVKILAAAQEERFTRVKNDEHFPKNAIASCLQIANLKPSDVDSVIFYEKPWLTFERILETHLAHAPAGLTAFLMALPRWMSGKFNMRHTLRKEFKKMGWKDPQILFSYHHLSHASSAFYPSPFESAAILCLDGVGEWATTSTWTGNGKNITPLWEINFPHSLGLLYSAFTHFCGFKVNSGEYKLMGLAPYGEPKYIDVILKNLIDLKEDGTFKLNMEYFSYEVGLNMINKKFCSLFSSQPRASEQPLRQIDLDLAASIQKVTDLVILSLAKTLRKETGQKNLCLSGGVALNCVANGLLVKEKIFENIWIQPASGDAGGALGAALAAAHQYFNGDRTPQSPDLMEGSYLGPAFTDAEIETELKKLNLVYHRLSENDLIDKSAALLQEQNVIGWFHGKMEYGPRALGNRSILADARNQDMQKNVNLKIKFREGFRPFAPIIQQEKQSDYFDLNTSSPYMTFVGNIKEKYRTAAAPKSLNGLEKMNHPTSLFPAITHVDYSSRVQSVSSKLSPLLHRLLSAFESQTGAPILLNTSFNVRGEPLVCSPLDAIRCFLNTNIDALAIGSFLILKNEQPKGLRNESWRDQFAQD